MKADWDVHYLMQVQLQGEAFQNDAIFWGWDMLYTCPLCAGNVLFWCLAFARVFWTWQFDVIQTVEVYLGLREQQSVLARNLIPQLAELSAEMKTNCSSSGSQSLRKRMNLSSLCEQAQKR